MKGNKTGQAQGFVTTSYPIHYQTRKKTIEVQVPNLPLNFFVGPAVSAPPYITYIQDHAEWKHAMQPWKSNDQLQRSCRTDLESIQLGFPGIDDKNTVLALAAHLVYTCDIDDIIEALDPVSAEGCVAKCAKILQGHDHPRLGSQTNNQDCQLRRAEEISALYYQRLTKLFNASAALKILEDVQSMVAGQLPELIHNRKKAPLKNFTHYLQLRERPLGVRPLLTIAEQYCLSTGEFLRNNPSLESLKDRIVRLAIVQNDLGGMEKDLATFNRSNAVVALYELTEDCRGQPRSLDSIWENIQLARDWHDRLLMEVRAAYVDMQERSDSHGVKTFLDVAIALCVTHLRWTLSTQRYSIDSYSGREEK